MKRTMKSYLIIGMLLFTQSAMALSLDEAKGKGLLGESESGYLEAVQSASGEVAALRDEINAKRRAEYEAIAKKNGTNLKAVETLAGKKAVEKTAPGRYVRVNGAWIKK